MATQVKQYKLGGILQTKEQTKGNKQYQLKENITIKWRSNPQSPYPLLQRNSNPLGQMAKEFI